MSEEFKYELRYTTAFYFAKGKNGHISFSPFFVKKPHTRDNNVQRQK